MLTAVIPDTGNGVTLALAMVGQYESDPNVDTGRVLDVVVDNYGAYIEGPVADSIEDYVDHTKELNHYIASFPPGLPPEQLNAAIDQYVSDQGPEWTERFEALQDEV